MTASVHILPLRDHAERALSQEELDVATIRAPRGTYDERIILAAAQRLKYSRDWANANLGRVVEGAIFSAAALSNPSEGQHQALGRRAIGLRHIAYSALVALAVMGGVSVVETAVGSYRAAVAMR